MNDGKQPTAASTACIKKQWTAATTVAALPFAFTIVIAGARYLPHSLMTGLELGTNLMAIAFAGIAILHPSVRRAAFPLVMAIGLAEMIYRLSPLRELLLGTRGGRRPMPGAQQPAPSHLRRSRIRHSVVGRVGCVLWLLARRNPAVPPAIEMRQTKRRHQCPPGLARSQS